MVLSPSQQMFIVSITLGCAIVFVICLIALRWLRIQSEQVRPRVQPRGIGSDLPTMKYQPMTFRELLPMTLMAPLRLGANVPLCDLPQ